MGYKYRCVADRVVLTAKQKERRVEAVKSWICGKIDLDQVIFSDECKFTLDDNDRSMTWVKNTTHRSEKDLSEAALFWFVVAYLEAAC